MKVELIIPSGTLFQTPKTDFEHARVWTRVFPIDKRRHTYRHKSSESQLNSPVWGLTSLAQLLYSLHSFINLVNFIGIQQFLNLRGGIPNKMGGEEGGSPKSKVLHVFQ